ncbi:MAG: DEAD/DEAH box helicase [Oscillospiraceae bacterium]|jgi:DEAD/DEAH box helicase domain-containing protein|nr:DEAD/DEAH box helicase [Oscillospiraceae bacterium]
MQATVKPSGIAAWLAARRADSAFMRNVALWRVIPARPAQTAPFPDWLHPDIPAALHQRGVASPYTHQRAALDALRLGNHIVIVTPTASGKTLCYNLPTLDAILRNPDARALYLFPTKALGSDQVASLYELVQTLGADVKTFTYDGDTPASARRAIREAGHVVVTNPDMLHSNILPNHVKWVKLFENLRYVVIDELHAYRGVFGSNMANVIRRLKRLCAFYGSHPQFICCSATIANPRELAQTLLEEPFTLISDNGAPHGERHVIFYNPPVVNRQLGIRKGAVNETREIAKSLLHSNVSSIVFAKSRLQVEVLTHTLKQQARDPLGNSGQVRGYRGGYLPSERRDIERGLRAGTVKTVVSTNALELGIDIGSIESCVLCGYPGTIASTWQQAGRAGRRSGSSVTVMVATSSPLDQYLMAHPEYFFDSSPENALAQPDNFHVLINHFKCAAYELPFKADERYGDLDDTSDLLDTLTGNGFLRRVNDRFHWMSEELPSAEVHLRVAGEENFVIIDKTKPDPRVIGEMDRFTVPMLLHEHAIYLHEGRQYQVEKLDFPNKKAFVRQVDVDYYTDADMATQLRVIDEFEHDASPLPRSFGEVVVSSMVTIFKKMKLDTHENLGHGFVDLPETQMQTTACWITLPEERCAMLSKDRLQNGMLGVAHLLGSLAPLYLMCARSDIAVHYHSRDPFTQLPTIYLYDAIPGGVGLSDKVYLLLGALLAHARDVIMACPCDSGCPSCVGPAPGDQDAKSAALDVLAAWGGAVARG